MRYSISVLRGAQKELAKAPLGEYSHICEKIENLAANPRPSGCKKLIARPGYRIRVGKYRVIYEIDDKQKSILILHVGHRKDIYS